MDCFGLNSTLNDRLESTEWFELLSVFKGRFEAADCLWLFCKFHLRSKVTGAFGDCVNACDCDRVDIAAGTLRAIRGLKKHSQTLLGNRLPHLFA